ncbi:unnamed protein product [Gemmataceae bacterium]|nr:unnamed protein product [Gemmataceae bacterium]VTU00915.1 unnamed protein product [Gemmataceae bacterium]
MARVKKDRGAADEAAGDEQTERVRRLAAGLVALTELVRTMITPLKPGPARGALLVALNEFTVTTIAALSPPKRPRKPRPPRGTLTDGWVGG